LRDTATPGLGRATSWCAALTSARENAARAAAPAAGWIEPAGRRTNSAARAHAAAPAIAGAAVGGSAARQVTETRQGQVRTSTAHQHDAEGEQDRS
jgi:hypothetical protein